MGTPGCKPRAANSRLCAAGKPAEGGLRIGVELPAFGWIRIVVAMPLGADVRGEVVEVGRGERLGPVSVLPREAGRQEGAVCDVVGRGPLQLANEVRERGGWREAHHHVDMIVGAPGREEGTVEATGVVSEHRQEGDVEGGRQQRPSPTRGPDDVHENDSRRPSGRGSPLASASGSCGRSVGGHGNRSGTRLVPRA